MKGAPITSQACNLDIRLSEGSLHLYEVCPWPSHQVPVRPYAEDCAAQEAEKQEGRYCPDTKRNCQYLTPSANELNNMLDEAKAAGRQAVIGECIGEIKKMITPLDLDDESDYWRSVVLNETIAALEKLRDK
jgi:hypothetical protein